MGTPCHFALFDLQPSFRTDLDKLATRYRELAREVHPDRFADASEREQRVALEKSAALNDAYQTLRSAPRRARYLLAIGGHEVPQRSRSTTRTSCCSRCSGVKSSKSCRTKPTSMAWPCSRSA